ILVETAFISNPEEERRLSEPQHQQRIAEAIFSGVRSYLIRHAAAQRGNDLAAELDVGMQLFAAEIQKTVLEAQFL
ncbi:MAG TPA: N-acetylmuramoyl-L-alanine amidase, partial [Fibrobacteres bacterium]|nr:N-acetylmuramoyl-L-alanine amidase [Fibrobacterota bacterium]